MEGGPYEEYPSSDVNRCGILHGFYLHSQAELPQAPQAPVLSLPLP